MKDTPAVQGSSRVSAYHGCDGIFCGVRRGCSLWALGSKVCRVVAFVSGGLAYWRQSPA